MLETGLIRGTGRVFCFLNHILRCNSALFGKIKILFSVGHNLVDLEAC